MRRMSVGVFAFGLAIIALLGYMAMSEGAKEGNLMSGCIHDKLNSLNQYVTDKKAAYRIAIHTCDKYNRDGIVRAPVIGI